MNGPGCVFGESKRNFLRKAPAHPFHKLHEADRRSPYCNIVNSAQTIIRPPMHSFRFDRKRHEHARISPQSHPKLLRFPDAAVVC